MRRPFLIIASILFFFQAVSGQELPITTQVFLNPYFYNPAFAGFENRPALSLGSRQQWTAIEGAPKTMTFNFHTAIAEKIPFGVNVYSHKRGILSTTHALLSVGYRARFDEENHYLSFAISGGAAFNSLDLDLNNNSLANDYVISAAMNNKTMLDGNAGLLYHNNGFNLGISLPKLFVTGITDTSAVGGSLQIGDLNPLNEGIAMLNYKLKLSDDGMAVDPWVIYHYNSYGTGQLEANARMIVKDFMWVGGGYRMDYGASAFFGFNIKSNFKFGYAYELGSSELGTGASHEFQVSLIFGKTEKEKRKGSFYERRRAMLNTMRGNTQTTAPAQNQNLYAPQNDPFAQPEPQKETAPASNLYGNPEPEETAPPAQPEEKPVLSAFDTPKKEEVTTRNETGIYIGPKVVKKGDHLLELEQGYYVIVGTFDSYRDAEEYSDKLFMQGYYTKFGYISQTTDYYVYLFYNQDNYQECVDTIERFKQITSALGNMWVLTVE